MSATATATAPPPTRAATPGGLRRATRVGLIMGTVGLYLAMTGIAERFHDRNVITGAGREGLLQLSRAMLGIVLVLAGYLAARSKKAEEADGGVAGGTLAGLIAGSMTGLLVVVVDALVDAGIQPREIFNALSPELLGTVLGFGQSSFVAALILAGGGAALGAIGAGLRLMNPGARKPILVGLLAALVMSLAEPLLIPIISNLEFETDWLYEGHGLTVLGTILVVLIAAAATVWVERRRRAKPTAPPPIAGKVPAPEREDRVAMGAGGAALALALVIVVIFFGEDAQLQPFVLLVALALGIGAMVYATVRGRHLAAEGKRRPTLLLLGLLGGAASLAIILPPLVGDRLADILGTVGLYVLLGLGLNIVIGYAGLLDLGYVAFFATGAYATAIFTAKTSFLVSTSGVGVTTLDVAEKGFTNFWFALPLAVIISVLIGVAIGGPVLRLRGDYLAIVTLGFGEIIRVLVSSNWLDKWLGGAQGIIQIPPIPPEALDLRNASRIYYLILIFVLIAAFISYRLVDSRVGRAWAAMREDESVAESMGVSVIKYKLLAFAMGAGIGSLGGTFFAAKLGSVFPSSFKFLVSINVLAVIILGGMGSIPGVIVGAFVLVGLPELLREFAEYRLLFYGAILMAIMIYRPEGLIPNVRRKRELKEFEDEDAQYDERIGEGGAEPTVTMGEKDEDKG